jgi:hypothetical protein
MGRKVVELFPTTGPLLLVVCSDRKKRTTHTSERPTMQYTPYLLLDTTGEFLGGSLIGAHDNTDADAELLNICLASLDLVGCN